MSNTNEYSQMSKNTVSSKGQMKFGESIFIDNMDGKGKRILFVGNSITLHDARESLGWPNFCGMAASTPEKDYVHIIKCRVSETDEDALVADLLKEYDVDEDTARTCVRQFVEKLNENGFLA